MAVTSGRSRARLDGRALTAVIVREFTNFRSIWRPFTFECTVEPTIYLLAFGVGFGALVSTVEGHSYVEFLGTGLVATSVMIYCTFPVAYWTFIKAEFQHTYDAILSAPVDAEELVTGEAVAVAARMGVYGCAPLLVTMIFGLDPSAGMLLVPLIAAVAAFGWASLGIVMGATIRQVDSISFWQSGLLRPLFLVGGTFFPVGDLPWPVRVLAVTNPIFHCAELVRHAVFGTMTWNDVGHLAVILGFALGMWRLAIRCVDRKVIV